MRDIALTEPVVESLGRDAELACQFCALAVTGEGFDGAVDDGHNATYPKNRYTVKSGYRNSARAPEIPTWHTDDVPKGIDLSAETPFHLETVRNRMKELGLSQAKLADEMGLPQSAVSNLLGGRRQVKVHEASFIYKRLGIETERTVDFVPVIGISSAGNWREAVQLPLRVMPMPPNLAGARAFAVELQGDSMDELIEEGSFVVVDPDQTQLYTDKVYLIENDDHETQVKLYRSNPARFEPASSNESYPTLFMGEHPIRVIGRVVWKGAPL